MFGTRIGREHFDKNQARSVQRAETNSYLKMIVMAKLVWAFDMKADGKVDDSVDTGYHGGILVVPKRFSLKLSPRSAAHVKVIEGDFVKAAQFSSKFK